MELQTIFQSKYGDTIEVEDVRYEAYKYALYLNNLSNINYMPKIRNNKDGSYTILCKEVSDLTFISF